MGLAVAQMLQTMLDNGEITSPSVDNHLFVVIMPTGYADQADGNGGHSFFDSTSNNRINFAYVNGSTTLDGYTLSASIKIVDAITNPWSNGWYGITINADTSVSTVEVCLD